MKKPALNPLPDDKFEIIQLLRFVAALMVIILHSTFYTSERLDPGTTVYNQGFYGVNLFFAISGFVMIISSEKLLGNPRGWMIFGVKRIIRIVPIYWIVTSYKLIVSLFAATLVLHTRLDPVFIIKSYFFIPAVNSDNKLQPFYGVGWTLNFEMFFYFLFAIALAFKIRPIVLSAIILIPLSIISIFKTHSWPAIAAFYADPIILNFLYGMIIAKLVQNGIKLPRPLVVPLVLVSLLVIFFPVGVFPLLTYLTYSPVAIHISTFLVVYGGASVEGYWGKKVPSLLLFLGAASYSLYLIHPSVSPLAPTLMKFFHLKSAFLSIILGVLGSIFAGSVFYLLCEKPITKMLTALSRRSDKLGQSAVQTRSYPAGEVEKVK